MSQFDLDRARKLLQQFDFRTLFIEELGWEQPGQPRPDTLTYDGVSYTRRQIAQLSGVVIFELTAANGQMPETKARDAVQRQISQQYYENLLIFVDQARTQSVWYWVKRDGSRRYPRSHTFVKGQTGDLFLSKISAMFVDMSELDEQGNIPVVEVAQRMKAALDVERVTKRFFDEFQLAHSNFLGHIGGIDDERERRWYTSVILNRVMFIWFLQRKGFINKGDLNYLTAKLSACHSQAADQYYPRFLQTLFFEGFAKPEDQRDPATKNLLGEVKYLNGGLFLPHPIEEKYGQRINIPDAAFAELFDLFNRFSWNLDDSVGGRDDEINPDVLGYIFEKYINQKEFGAYYTRPEITEYLCEQTIHKLILDKLAELNPVVRGLPIPPRYETIGDLIIKIDAPRIKQLLFSILPNLSLLDPACGSGAFLVAAMKTLVVIYQGVINRIEFLRDGELTYWLDKARAEHPSLTYFIKKQIITQNLYGVDIMAEAVEIARLRLFLALVASAWKVDHLEPLPNIDFNVLSGNSLIGLLRVDEAAFNRYTQTGSGQAAQLDLFAGQKAKTYHQTVAEKNRLVKTYRDASTYTTDLQTLRDDILAHRQMANATLNQILLDEFGRLGIMFEQATWDTAKNIEGKPQKRALQLADIEALQPFHWGYEFDEVMNERGGFDVIITNPPWEVFQTDEKEFFSEYSDVIYKKKMSILDFTEKKDELLQDPEVQEAWLEYSSKFPHQNSFFKKASQYVNQTSTIDGRNIPGKNNLYKIFLEQCYNLLGVDGVCGIVIPTSFYVDADKKQLRELFFTKTRIKGLFGFSNERFIFEGVDHRFKFTLFTFEKGGSTNSFFAAFRNHPSEAIHPSELEAFLDNRDKHLEISLAIVRSLSPDYLSVMEFKDNLDIQISNKLSKFPALGEEVKGKWNLRFTTEFDKTATKDLFKLSPSRNNYPLYSGGMIHYFTHSHAAPQYYINSKKGKERLIGKSGNINGDFACDQYRLIHRRVARQTDTRTLICSIIPKNCFCDNSVNVVIPGSSSASELIFACAILSSFVVDFQVRQRLNNNITINLMNQLPVPRLTEKDLVFAPIVERATKLICTTPEFDDLAREVGLGSHKNGVTDPVQRVALRAELDGLIAHVYGLTEAEFSHILSTFPLVAAKVKEATLEAYRRFAPDPEVIALIAGDESERVEFKVAARRDPHTGKDGGQKMSDNVVKAVAGMMNGGGGTVLIGVTDDDHRVAGVNVEYEIVNKNKPNWDSYRLFLEGLLKDKLSIANAFQFYQLSRHKVEGKDVCRIQVSLAPEPVYVDNRLYVRTGNKTSELQGPHLVAYVRSDRWG